MKKNKTVYFLGAGFSRSANFPLQNGILSQIRNYSPSSVLNEDIDLFAAFHRFFEHRKITDSFLNHVFSLNSNPNLEDVFTLLDHSIAERTFCRGISWKRLVTVDESLKSTILFCLHEASIKVTPEAQKLYRLVASYLLKMRLAEKEKISVISLNWDSLLEDSIYYWINSLKQAKKIDVDYCCYTMPLEGSDHVPSITQKAKNISNFKILKLHGSSNWLVCESCKKIFTGVGSDKSAFQLYFGGTTRCKECETSSLNRGPKLQPFIITPTYLKTFPNPHIQNVWLNAFTELSEASKVVFIGYSLPEADFYVRSLLKRAIRPECEIEVVLWKTDNPTPKQKSLSHLFARSRYEGFFVGNSLRFNFEGLAGHFSDKIPKSMGTAKASLKRLI